MTLKGLERVERSPSLHMPHLEYLVSLLRLASAIQAEKFHTDDVNLPRIQASLQALLETY